MGNLEPEEIVFRQTSDYLKQLSASFALFRADSISLLLSSVQGEGRSTLCSQKLYVPTVFQHSWIVSMICVPTICRTTVRIMVCGLFGNISELW